jgi:hypothetical protein
VILAEILQRMDSTSKLVRYKSFEVGDVVPGYVQVVEIEKTGLDR